MCIIHFHLVWFGSDQKRHSHEDINKSETYEVYEVSIHTGNTLKYFTFAIYTVRCSVFMAVCVHVCTYYECMRARTNECVCVCVFGGVFICECLCSCLSFVPSPCVCVLL